MLRFERWLKTERLIIRKYKTVMSTLAECYFNYEET